MTNPRKISGDALREATSLPEWGDFLATFKALGGEWPPDSAEEGVQAEIEWLRDRLARYEPREDSYWGTGT